MVTEEDFVEAHQELVPSVSADELRHYDRVRRQFEGAGKKEEEKTGGNQALQPAVNGKGKGKAAVPIDDAETIVIRAEKLDLNGEGGAGGSRGNGKSSVSSHVGKSSVDIAEGGFGDSTEDGDLYS